MTDSAVKAAGSVATSTVSVGSEILDKADSSASSSSSSSSLSGNQGLQVAKAPIWATVIQTYRGAIVWGGALLGAGVALWSVAAQDASNSVVAIFGLVAGVLVAAGSLQQSLYGKALRGQPHDIFSLLPLGGLFLVGISAISQFFIPALTPSAQVSAAPLLLAGCYVLLRALSARGWAYAGTEGLALFPPRERPQSPVVVGERIQLRAGTVAAVDTRILSGSVAVAERYLSPVPHFRIRDEEEVVFAGSTIVGGSAEGVALSSSNDSCLQRLEAAIATELTAAESCCQNRDRGVMRFSAYALLFCSVAAAIFWNERTTAPSMVIAAAGMVLFAGSLGIVADIVYSSYGRLVRSWASRGFVFLREESCLQLAESKQVVFDPSTVGPDSFCEVRELELLDDRVAKEALCGTIASFVGRADDAALQALGDYSYHLVPHVQPERVVDFREYDGWGISGSIKGVEFSIGSEGFLVERGIMIQPSDSVSSVAQDERLIMIAIDSDVIARCVVAFGQASLLAENKAAWSALENTVGKAASIEQREFPSDVLLVRGNESDAVGRGHTNQLATLRQGTLKPPNATVLLLQNRLSSVPELLQDCRESVKWTALCRSLIVCAGVALVAAVFVGLVTPLVPLVVLPLSIVLVLL